ncbi:hypothetical protein Q5752_000618 [Cryptotrichosporon argae]
MSLESAVRRALDPAFDSLELLTPAFLSQPSSPPASSCSPSTSRPHIAILDSSFNPPTLAHQAIASSSFPPRLADSTSTDDEPGDYMARLVLFSARNVDKTLGAGDASPAQRAEMMLVLASSLPSLYAPHTSASVAPSTLPPDIGVGLLSAATFAGKARVLRAFLAAHRPQVRPALTFLIGTDTLARLFEPRYYADMAAELDAFFADNWIVCARRGGADARAVEDEVLARPGVRDWVRRGRVRLVGSGHDGWEDVSSTRIRQRIRSGEGLDGLCTKEIEAYVREQGLYRS